MQISVEDIEGDAFQNFLDYNRSPKTLRNYKINLKLFIDAIPNDIFTKYLGESASEDEKERTNQFVALARKKYQDSKINCKSIRQRTKSTS